jgi:hypothetical protein
MKNYLGQSVAFVALLVVFLTSLRFLPAPLRIGDYTLRRMDVLADVSNDTVPAANEPVEEFIPDTTLYAPDSLHLDTLRTDTAQVQGPLPPADSLDWGRLIEDYTFTQQGLAPFFRAIDSIRTRGRTVRIAFYGDSFVEGDILIGDLRDTLQSIWGGAGVGFVPITSEVARFKRTLVHEYRHWNTLSIVKNKENTRPFGLNGYVYVPQADASVRYDGAHYFHHTRNWTQMRIFYSVPGATPMIWQIKDTPPQAIQLPGTGHRLGTWNKELPYPGTEAFAFRFPQPDSNLLLFGATLESGPGVYIDNFSIRGNSGGPLKRMRPEFIQQFDAQQRYDLVVIQVGLNAVTNSLNNIKWYRAELDRTFEHLKRCFPGKTILVMSVGDRGGKNGSELATMKSVPYIVAMQRDLARQHGFLFYDLFRGMGGYGAMIRLADHKPMLANKDYTHLTHEGGRRVGLDFARLLLEEQRKFKEKGGQL